MKRGIGIVLAALLAVGVVAAIVVGRGLGSSTPTAGGTDGGTAGTVQVRGIVGSEKVAFFRDPKVVEAFAKHGLTVTVTPAGSRDIATFKDLPTYDFVFPSSSPAADKVRRSTPTKGVFSPFYSPLVVGSWGPIVDVLQQNKVVTKGPGGASMLDLHAYAALTSKSTRWDKLPGNSAYPASKNLLVTTTDVRRSNSAAMYLAAMSYVLNGDSVVTAGANATAMTARTAPLFLGQGYSGGSSEEPFEDYLSLGMGKSPLVLAYESQFLDRQIRKDGSVTKDMRLLYPSPDVLCKHTVVALKDPGVQVGQLLTNDADLAQLAARYGFRTQNRQVFVKTLADAGVAAPPDLVNVIEPPSYEALEQMIAGIEKLYG